MWGAISSDNRWAVTCTQHGWGIKVWEIPTGKLVKDIPAGNYSEASFSPDARWLVTTSLTNQRQTWIVGTWQEIPYEKRHGGGVFSPDGRLLAMTHRAGSMVFRQGLELVDTMTGRQLVTLTAADQLPVGQMAFTPDGSQLAVGTTGSGIRLWDLVAIRRQLAEMNLDWNLPEESKLAFTVGRSREPEKKSTSRPIPHMHARQVLKGVQPHPCNLSVHAESSRSIASKDIRIAWKQSLFLLTVHFWLRQVSIARSKFGIGPEVDCDTRYASIPETCSSSLFRRMVRRSHRQHGIER